MQLLAIWLHGPKPHIVLYLQQQWYHRQMDGNTRTRNYQEFCNARPVLYVTGYGPPRDT